MKFTAPRNSFNAALANAIKATESRNTIPILNNVLLTACGGALTIATTDLDIAVTATIGVEVSLDGAATVNARTLAAIVAKLPNGASVSIEATDNSIVLRSGRMKSTILTLPAGDFPSFDAPRDSKIFSMTTAALAGLIRITEPSISTEETRYYLNGIFLHEAIDEGAAMLRAVSTDGHKMARTQIALPVGASGMPGVIVPRKAVALLKGLAEKDAGDVTISVSQAKIKFDFASGVALTSKLIDGTFPEYGRVIPRGNANVARFDREAMAAAVSRVSAIKSERGSAIKLEFSEDRIEISSRGEDGDTASDVIDAQYDGTPMYIGFNAGYLASHLAVLEAEIAMIAMADAGSPALVIESLGAPTLLVLMPMRV